MSPGRAIAIGAVTGLALGIAVSFTTEVPLAPEAGLAVGGLIGWLSGRTAPRRMRRRVLSGLEVRRAVRLGTTAGVELRLVRRARGRVVVITATDDAGHTVGHVELAEAPVAERAGSLRRLDVDPAARGAGVGGAIVAAALRHGFEQVGWHRISARMDAENVAAERCLQRLGFVEDALLRDADRVAERFRDVKVLGILEQEWRGGARRQPDRRPEPTPEPQNSVDAPVDLVPFERSHFDLLMACSRSPADLFSWAGTSFRFPLDPRQLRRHLRGAPAAGRRLFTALDRATGEPVGHLELVGVDLRRRQAYATRGVVAPWRRRTGVGRAMMSGLLEKSFVELGLHRIEARVVEGNTAALRAWAGMGFRYEGLLRELARSEDRWIGFVPMAILEPEWRRSAHAHVYG
jgi:RimJ/RimL family protein N-acetyltransferase